MTVVALNSPKLDILIQSGPLDCDLDVQDQKFKHQSTTSIDRTLCLVKASSTSVDQTYFGQYLVIPESKKNFGRLTSSTSVDKLLQFWSTKHI